jgi:hypothetical protein
VEESVLGEFIFADFFTELLPFYEFTKLNTFTTTGCSGRKFVPTSKLRQMFQEFCMKGEFLSEAGRLQISYSS